MHIVRKITWGFALVVVAVVATSIFCMRIFWHIDQDRLRIRSEVMSNVQQTMRLFEALVDMDRWIATYLLHGDADALEKARGAFTKIQVVCHDHAEDLG